MIASATLALSLACPLLPMPLPSMVGEGTLRILHEPAPPVKGAQEVVLGDFDGDGDADAFVGVAANPFSEPDAANALLENQGDGVFVDVSERLPFAGRAKHAAAFDADGDGDLDLFTAFSWATHEHALLLNDGSGTFVDGSSQLLATPGRVAGVAVGDVDGDGVGDLWILNENQPDQLLLNDGLGVFSDTPSQLPSGLFDGVAICLGDVDADGDLDAFRYGSSASAQSNLLALNDGAGLFTLSPTQPVTSEILGWPVFIDVDGDTDLDLWAVADSFSDPHMVVLANDGTGVLVEVPSSVQRLPLESPISSVVAADLRASGAIDVVVGTEDSSPDFFEPPGSLVPGVLVLVLGDGAGGFSVAPNAFPKIDQSSHAIDVSDLDGDGDVDLFAVLQERNSIQFNDGNGLFGYAGMPLPSRGDVATIADFNNDGWSDVYAGPGELWLGNGTRAFELADGTFPPEPYGWFGGSAGDVDNDGDMDLVLATINDDEDPNAPYSSQDARLWLNDGAGNFTDVTATQLPQYGIDRGLTIKTFPDDVDDDGDLDIVLASLEDNDGTGSGAQLYLNDGSGTFVEISVPVFFFYNADLPVMGDVDGDGDRDFLSLQNVWGACALRNEGGAPYFTDMTSQVPDLSLGFPRGISLGDADGDGDLDWFVAYKQYDPDYPDVAGVWTNDGMGTFTGTVDEVELALAPLEFGDFDEDGDLDLVDADIWFENDGSGVFLEGAESLLSGSLTGTFVDIDLDGDLDVLGSALQTNLNRQITFRTVASVGKPLTMEIDGPASTPWALFASSAPLAAPVETDYGNLLFDPLGLILLDTGALDADGDAAPTYSVPGNPALVGLSVWWQGLVGAPLRLTNLEATEITAF